MLNKVILMGRLCADPDFRQTQEFELPSTDHIRQSPPENDRLILSMLFAGGNRRNL